MFILELAGNTRRMNVAFPMVDFLQRRQLLQSQLILKLAKIKNKILTRRKTVLEKVKIYIDDNLNPAKVNVVDPTRDNFTQQLSIQEILNELENLRMIITKPCQY